MKVAQVNLQRDWGGAERHVLLLSKSLRDAGAEIELYCHPRGGLRRAAELESLSCRFVTARNQLDLTAAVGLAVQLGRFQPDVLHLHTPKDYVCGYLASKFLRHTALVLTRHMMLPVKPMMRRLYSRSHAVLCLSDSVREHLIRQEIPQGLLYRVNPGIETDQFDTSRTREQRFSNRSHWGAAPGDVVYGCVGRLVAGKGHEDLLIAFAQILSKSELQLSGTPAVRLVLFGEGPLQSLLQEQTASLKVKDHIHFAGFCADIPGALSGLDVLVLPSHSELLPLSILEGMSSGLPVIATEVGGIPEIVEAELTGLLVPPGDPVALVEAIKRLARDPELRSRLGARGQERVRRDFTLQAMSENTLDIYQNITEQHQQ
jgi:glycosyltransferase involved in cell wall biosynthesis